MHFCANCNGTFSMIELNDDGETYTIHLHENDKPVDVKVDWTTLEKLGDAIQIQMIMRDKFTIEPFEEEI